jgi:Icc-related predicted phosphoesterase
MKIQIASDLHLEFLEKRFPGCGMIEAADADVLVIAGDIHRHARAIQAFRDWPVPVVYVHGNHELYGAHGADTVTEMREAAAGTHVHYLERDEYVRKGVRFLGCCLWTDYRLYSGDRLAAMAEAENCLNDHRLIHTDEGIFTASDAEDLHLQSRRWLQMKLEESYAGPTVVVTHHAPHPNSIHPRFAGSMLNPAFVSDLTALMGKADLWIHGHVHDSVDYRVLGTRVIANPRGYAMNLRAVQSPEQLQWENALFDPQLIIEL